MVRKNYPENLLCETDDGVIIPWTIYKVDKQMDAHVDFKVDLRLVALNPIIHHFKDSEEWWEVFMPRVYRIACKYINLTGTGEPFNVTEDSINGYRICKGFLMAEGSDFNSMQAMFDDSGIEGFFE